ncbi:hypothetical protein BD410DRAFT_588719 [Rickenella mellea]|uniref:Uncharacterized protein n=1 Tax=Rickenella mellea TaxID=50990 RepID=A0A4Y7PPY9_9AGAM|nr:hypothetical protein BD410DRAFT_588719 [Rickenella mellea]
MPIGPKQAFLFLKNRITRTVDGLEDRIPIDLGEKALCTSGSNNEESSSEIEALDLDTETRGSEPSWGSRAQFTNSSTAVGCSDGGTDMTTGLFDTMLLPDEVLAYIFEIGEDYWEDGVGAFAVSVSHVSHRFRDIALQTARLWTSLSTNFCADKTGTFLHRSKNGNLDVNFIPASLSRAIKDQETVAVKLIRQSHRWEHLRIDDDCSPNTLNLISPVLRTSSYILPRLRSIEHNGIEKQRISLPLPNAPSLTHFYGNNSYPSIVRVTTVTNAELFFGGSMGLGRLYLRDFIDVLATPFKNVLSLTLTFDSLSTTDAMNRSFSMPSVQTLSINVRLSTKLALTNVVNHAHFPKVSTLRVSLHLMCQDDDIHGYLNTIICSQSDFGATVTSLRIHLQTAGVSLQSRDSVSSKEVFLKQLFQDFWRLQHLDIRATTIPFPEGKGIWEGLLENLPPLHTLSFEQCDGLYPWHLTSLTRKLREIPHSLTFVGLRINRCRNLSSEFLDTVQDLMDGKLTWTGVERGAYVKSLATLR